MAQGDMSVREAGKKGGNKRKEELGPEGYSKLGHMAHSASSKGGQKGKKSTDEDKKSEGGEEGEAM